MATAGLRIGHGFDVHRFSTEFDPDKPLILAGCLIAEQRSLEAHSDGDEILHAICDAMLGAIAAGDIGEHFPDSDATWRNADSGALLEQVMQLAGRQNFTPVNVDVTVVAQVPKLSPYRQQMRSSLCRLLQLDPDRVNLKATTTEGLGSIGREEGIACHAVVLMHTDA